MGTVAGLPEEPRLLLIAAAASATAFSSSRSLAASPTHTYAAHGVCRDLSSCKDGGLDIAVKLQRPSA
jgi:hypothetical protein